VDEIGCTVIEHSHSEGVISLLFMLVMALES